MREVQYYHPDAGRAWRRKEKAADAAFFFAPGMTASGRVEASRGGSPGLVHDAAN